MRKTVYKSRAIMKLLLIIALAVILSIWPLRVVRRAIVIEGNGEPLVKSEAINDNRSFGQTFVARYDRLDSIDIYVSALEGGRYLTFSIRGEDGITLCERYVDLHGAGIPGYVSVPVGIDLTVNANYRMTIRGRFSSFRVATEPAGTSPQLAPGFFYYNDDVIADRQVRMRLRYDQPLAKGTSLLYMAVAAAVCVAAMLAVRAYYRRHPERDRLMLTGYAARPPLYAASLLFYGALFIMNFPMKRFHDAPFEIAFLAAGIVLACVLTLYAIRRITGDETTREPMPLPDRVMAVLSALTVAFCCEYMNGVSDAMHAESEKKILLCLAAMLVCAFVTPGKKAGMRVNRYGWFTLFVFACLVVFRNTRIWVVILTGFFALLYFRVGSRYGTRRWFAIVRAGILLHFFLAVGYCLLFRAFQAFNFARYPMIFHTVTVTAEYLSMVCAVTAAGMFACIAKQPVEAGIRGRLRAAWKDILLFGVSASYAVFTISRVAALATVGMVLMLIVVTTLKVFRMENKKRIVRTGDHLVAAVIAPVLAVALCLPAAFSMQRVMPALVRHHRVLKGIEEQWTLKPLVGKAEYDSPYYITASRFAALFSVRFFDGAEGIYNRPYDKYNYDEDGMLIYGWNGEELDYEKYMEMMASEEAKAPQTPAPQAQTSGEHLEEVSNGRFDIFRAYLRHIGLRGHPGIGLVTDEETYVHAHNTFLQSMYDFGIPAGVLFSAWIGVTILFGIYRYLCGPEEDNDDGASPQTHALHVTALTGAFAAASLVEWTFFLYNPVTVMLLMMTGPLLFNGAKHETG
ncbi:MAG: hypothetical protein IJQ21_04440 [Lachnospiraceae bacterium]|nr:hypothetical protein [Lachnospiraceae bacterium]